MRYLTLVFLVATAAAQQKPGISTFSVLRQQFADPPARYSTLPFFVWNGEMSEKVIDQHLADDRAQGVKGVFIHPRPGMITSYLSDRWFSLVRYTVDQSKSHHMETWLYDENSYPSGFAGGNVPAQMPESFNQGQGLTPRKFAKVPADAQCRVLMKKGGDGWQDVTGAAKPGDAGEFTCFEVSGYPVRAWNGGFSYVDLIKPGVTEKFIEITMRGYERSIGNEFGKTVPGIFTDEPNIAPPKGNTVRWTPDLFEQFRQRWGYDLQPKLMQLYEETGDWRKVRHDYYALLLDLLIERWSKPWQRYTTEHNLLWTGHYWEHAWPNPAHAPDHVALYAYHHVPAIDMLFNQFNEGVNAQFGNVRAIKELASVANQFGRERTLSETYGGGGWDLRFEDMKRLGDWEYVLGVNTMNQHLAFQTLAGARKHDYPQTFSYHEPWWNQYHLLGRYFARLSMALSAGKQINRIVVIESTSTAWMYSSPGKANQKMMDNATAFQEFVTALEHRQVEYDIASERIVRDVGKAQGKQFVVGQRAYDLVIVPPGTENLEGPTVKLLEAYGGRVLSFASPDRVDGAPSAALKSLAARWTKGEMGDAALTAPGFTVAQGSLLFHHRRKLQDGELVFLVNSSLEETARGSVALEGRSVQHLDAVTGRIAAYPAKIENGRLNAAFEIPPAGSLLLYTSSSGAPAAAPRPATETVVPAGEPLRIARLGPNALTIDYCDLNLAGKAEKDLYFFNAADKVFKYFGFEGNPWSTAVQYKTSILDRNKFAADSGFEATFWFQAASDLDKASLRAVVERPQYWSVAVNGKPVKPRPGEWWLDREFGVYDIGANVVEGRNGVAIKAQPMNVHAEIEPLYITGNFGVAPRDTAGFRLVPNQDLKPGSWKEQALPFYSEAVSYSRTYKLRRDGAHYKVRLGKWSGTVAEVKVNGKSAGIVGWQPYDADITAALANGANKVEVLVYGSRKNLLGPHHNPARGIAAPGHFRTAPAAIPPGAKYDLFDYGLMDDFQLVRQ